MPYSPSIHEGTAPSAISYDAFLAGHPEYSSTAALDDLRARDYSRLDAANHIYLDYTGGGLYASSQVRDHAGLLTSNVFGNPHSVNPSSLAMTRLVDQARARVLEYFRADPAEYDVAFTANASAALKLVGESFPFQPGGAFALTVDNHNSVNGIREFARSKGAKVTYIPMVSPELRIDAECLHRTLHAVTGSAPRLFAFPAQSNFSGAQHPLDLIAGAQQTGWRVLLDAAAFVPTNILDLSQWKPDFVSVSFYKMFGYPTGAGALLIRKPALRMLQRPWFAGGTISMISVQGEGWHQPLPHAAKLEDGTVDYLSLPAVTIGLDHLESVGIETIHTRVECLTSWLLTALPGLRHRNDAPLVQIFGPCTIGSRGGTIAFNLLDPSGVPYHFRHIEGLAAEQRISLRTGGFCNPGANETAHGLTAEEMTHFFTESDLCSFDDFYERSQLHGKYPSTVRISTGIASNFDDVHRFVEFARTFLDRSAADIASVAPDWAFSETSVEIP
ncbi:aminotransferase class V-fold PLP-dependent enzyme [soil metagenome]